MSTNFFAEALKQALRERHFNQAQLAEFLGVDPAYVSRWLKGSSPRIDQIRNALTVLGWSLERARPDYDAFADAIAKVGPSGAALPTSAKEKVAHADIADIKELLEDAAETHKRRAIQPVRVVGRLLADTGHALFDTPNGESLEGVAAMFPQLPYAENLLSILIAEGHDLAPLIPHKARVFVRRILQPAGVPEGTIVLFESNSKNERLPLRRVVRLSEHRSGRVERLLGAPLIDRHEYVAFKPREGKMAWVIAGVVSLTAQS